MECMTNERAVVILNALDILDDLEIRGHIGQLYDIIHTSDDFELNNTARYIADILEEHFLIQIRERGIRLSETADGDIVFLEQMLSALLNLEYMADKTQLEDALVSGTDSLSKTVNCLMVVSEFTEFELYDVIAEVNSTFIEKLEYAYDDLDSEYFISPQYRSLNRLATWVNANTDIISIKDTIVNDMLNSGQNVNFPIDSLFNLIKPNLAEITLPETLALELTLLVLASSVEDEDVVSIAQQLNERLTEDLVLQSKVNFNIEYLLTSRG